MALTPKDVTGLLLVAATVMLLVVHGTGRHEPGGESFDAGGDTVRIESLTRAVHPGVRSDMVLLPGDPRIEGGPLIPEGLLLRGSWFSGHAGVPGATGPSSAVGGH